MRSAVRGALLASLGAFACVACAPALNWREVRPEGGAVVALLPCKPDRLTRTLDVAGAPVAVEVLACSAQGSTWALTSADVGDAARVDAALIQWRRARSANLGGKEVAINAVSLPGMAPSAQAVRLRVEGGRPDGQALSEEALLFAVGTRVFHAAVLGGSPDAEALSSFFSNLKIPR